MHMTPTISTEAGHFHAVKFYHDAESLCEIVGEFLVSGLAAGNPAIVIATPEHTARIEQCLAALGHDVDDLKRLGDLVTLDAADMLGTFMFDGVANAKAFRDNVGGAIKQVCRSREGCTVHAYGEMVNVLWKDGLEAAAIRLETLWNELANTHEFKLLCGYSMGNFYKGAAIEEIKGHHSHLISDVGQPAVY
jgi:hypothetical protein